MSRLRNHLLPTLIMVITFVFPICFLRTLSMYLEWYDHWIFFVWGQLSGVVRYREISLLDADLPIISSLNRILFSVVWVVLGITLVIKNFDEG